MMRQLILNLTILLSCIILFAQCNSDCDGCGGCEYENFTQSANVCYFEFAADSIILVEFKAIDAPHEYKLDAYDLTFIQMNFGPTEFRNSENTFLLSGERIINGTCQPYTIKSIRLLE